MKRVNPYFSIIIPCFNSAVSIFECISSILQQDFKNFEIVIVDNYSKDSTLNLLRDFNDYRINVYSESDSGVYDAMNKGIKLSKGKWIYFLGSDDYLYNNKVLSTVKNSIESSEHSVIYGNVLIKGSTGWAKDGEIYAGHFSKNRMLVKAICHQSVFYKKDFILKNSLWFDLRFYVSADWHFNLCCRRLTKFKYVDMIVAVFQAGGISSLKSDSFRDYIKNEFKDLLPSKFELRVKEFIKRIIYNANKAF